MHPKKKLIFLPLCLLSLIAIIHNAYLAKETASLHTGNKVWDWFLACVFALGIESGLWALIIYKRKKAIQAYTITLCALNLIYYGRDGKLNTIVSIMHPDAWLYIEGILTAIIFSVLLSGFAWFLTEIAMQTEVTLPDPVETVMVSDPIRIAVTHQIEPKLTVTLPEQSVTPTVKLCPSCNNTLTSNRKNALYCSSACKQENYRKNRKMSA